MSLKRGMSLARNLGILTSYSAFMHMISSVWSFMLLRLLRAASRMEVTVRMPKS